MRFTATMAELLLDIDSPACAGMSQTAPPAEPRRSSSPLTTPAGLHVPALVDTLTAGARMLATRLRHRRDVGSNDPGSGRLRLPLRDDRRRVLLWSGRGWTQAQIRGFDDMPPGRFAAPRLAQRRQLPGSKTAPSAASPATRRLYDPARPGAHPHPRAAGRHPDPHRGAACRVHAHPATPAGTLHPDATPNSAAPPSVRPTRRAARTSTTQRTAHATRQEPPPLSEPTLPCPRHSTRPRPGGSTTPFRSRMQTLAGTPWTISSSPRTVHLLLYPTANDVLCPCPTLPSSSTSTG